MGKGPGPMELGDALRGVLWRRRDWAPFVLLVAGVVGDVLGRASAAAGRSALEAGEAAERLARIAGTTAL